MSWPHALATWGENGLCVGRSCGTETPPSPGRRGADQERTLSAMSSFISPPRVAGTISACQLLSMTYEVSNPAGWVVTVTTPGHEPEIWDVAEQDRTAAVGVVSAKINATDEKIEARDPISQGVLDTL